MVSATLYVDGSQVKAVDLVSGLEKLVAQLPRHHFILIYQLGLLGQQAPHQRVNSTCQGDSEVILGMGVGCGHLSLLISLSTRHFFLR